MLLVCFSFLLLVVVVVVVIFGIVIALALGLFLLLLFLFLFIITVLSMITAIAFILTILTITKTKTPPETFGEIHGKDSPKMEGLFRDFAQVLDAAGKKDEALEVWGFVLSKQVGERRGDEGGRREGMGENQLTFFVFLFLVSFFAEEIENKMRLL